MARINKQLDNKSLEYVNIENPIVFVVDMINGFVNEGVLADKEIQKCIKPIGKILKRNPRALFIVDTHSEKAVEFNSFPEHCLIGSEECEIVKELVPYIGKNSIICKNSTNAFHAIDIEAVTNIYNSFIICGCCSDICIMQFALSLKTWLNQHNINKRVIIPVDAIDTYHIDEVHDAFDFNYYAIKMMEQSGIEIVKELTY